MSSEEQDHDKDAPNSQREQAYKELLSICEEKHVHIPQQVTNAIEGKVYNDAVDDREVPVEQQGHEKDSSTNSFLSVSISQNESERSSMHEEDELFREIVKVWRGLKASPPYYECRVTNGSYTVTTPVLLDEQQPQNKQSGRRAKQKIKRVHSELPGYKMLKKLKILLTTGKCNIKTKTEQKVVMEGVNLRLTSGKLYLVLGAPRSGKSTLLKLIADTLQKDKNHTAGGEVSINGIQSKLPEVIWQNLTGYIDQMDRLHKHLTVLETCEFAWQCRSGGTHARPFYDMQDESVKEVVKEMDKDLFVVNAVLKGMGLARVKDTFVGDNVSVRGVSGGEKKRVTVSEMWCIGVPVLCCDEISTGLDAATTYDIVKLMGAVARLTNTVRIISLLQPPPETVALFDELILLDSGHVIYSGPINQVVPYFESLGYQIPDRMDTADWLQALPTPDGAQYLQNNGTDRKHLTTLEFVQAFQSSNLGQALSDALEQPLEEDTDLLNDLATVKYKNRWTRSLKLLCEREMLLWWRDKYAIKARIIQDLVMGIVAGTLFWQQWENPQSVMGILFQSMFFIALGAMIRVPQQFDLRGILYKQQDANFYPTSSFVLGRSLAGVPTAVTDSLIYGTIIYWFVGLAYNDGASVANYFIFLLLVLMAALCTGLMFSVFSAVVSDKSTGQAAMSIALVLFVLFSGFTVQADVIPGYWIWFYWINMFAWILRSLAVNEYQSGKYDDEIVPGLTEGEAILTQFGFTLNGEPYEFVWVWYGLLFSVGLSILGVILSVYFLQALQFETGKSLATEKPEDDDEDDEGDAEIEEDEEEVVLPFQQVNLTFRNIRYTVTASTSNEKLVLLCGIDGYLEAGKMTALMGSSGAGKTTLMDVLSLRKTTGEISGDVRLNGHPQGPLSFRRCTGYVEQFDVQSPQLTIRETVEFSAALRLDETDPAVTKESRQKFVDQTLAMLELTVIQDLQVGSDETGGLSFEQNKRLSIAVELVANPSIIFLDEPTSGLDARAASIVMRGLKRIADGGRAVCATIHQPSIAIFTAFDSLLLLKRGGETVYFGDLGDDSVNLITYLESYPATKKILPGENPATWMLTTIGAGSSTGGTKPFDYAGSFEASSLRQQALRKIDKFEAEATDKNIVSFPNKYATSKRTQRRTVLRRALKIYNRSPTYNMVRLLVSVVVALLFGSVFASQRTPATEGDMNSRVTTIFITVIFLGLNSFNTVLSLSEVERNMFYRHRAALMYDQKSILLAFTLAEIPFILLSSLLFVVPFYFMLGFATVAYKFFLYYLFVTLYIALWTFLGQMMVSLTKNSVVAQGFGGLLQSMTTLFSGLLIRPQNISGFWVFAYWLLPGHYTLEGLVASQFHNDDTPITPSLGSDFFKFVQNSTECQNLPPLNRTQCTGTAEEWIGVSFGGEFRFEHVWYDCLYLVGAIVISKLVTYVALTKLNYLAK